MITRINPHFVRKYGKTTAMCLAAIKQGSFGKGKCIFLVPDKKTKEYYKRNILYLTGGAWPFRLRILTADEFYKKPKIDEGD